MVNQAIVSHSLPAINPMARHSRWYTQNRTLSTLAPFGQVGRRYVEPENNVGRSRFKMTKEPDSSTVEIKALAEITTLPHDME